MTVLEFTLILAPSLAGDFLLFLLGCVPESPETVFRDWELSPTVELIPASLSATGKL